MAGPLITTSGSQWNQYSRQGGGDISSIGTPRRRPQRIPEGFESGMEPTRMMHAAQQVAREIGRRRSRAWLLGGRLTKNSMPRCCLAEEDLRKIKRTMRRVYIPYSGVAVHLL
jgi:hypothetical protein